MEKKTASCNPLTPYNTDLHLLTLAIEFCTCVSLCKFYLFLWQPQVAVWEITPGWCVEYHRVDYGWVQRLQLGWGLDADAWLLEIGVFFFFLMKSNC